MNWRVHRRIVLLTIAIGLGCAAPEEGTAPKEVNAAFDLAQHPVSDGNEGTIGLGEGFLVWESNRSGRWRLWIRNLSGGTPRQLTPDEGRRLHCCPHISPDGRKIAYLSLPPDQDGYPQGGAVGVMMLIPPDGSAPEKIVDRARNYYENRAAVWTSPTELNYIDGEGFAARLDLETGKTSRLTEATSDSGPWLINSSLSWAASGHGAFSPFDAARRRVVDRGPRPGCQPYFSHDGLWGFWVMAPGGPINRLHLESGRDTTLLSKSDPRLPADRGYLYFPMLSADGRLLAFAASNDEHAHFSADYDVFVVETDPRTLELLGDPIRFTHHPATDRFPDVFRSPLALGRQQGEAPFRWIPDPELPLRDWQWSFGDGATARGPAAEHLYSRPGRFEIVARSGETTLRGQIVITEAAAPVVLASSLRDQGNEIVVVFDEPVEVSNLAATLQSGTPIAGHVLDGDGQRLKLRLAEPLTTDDLLHLTGITDQAQTPNALPQMDLTITLPTWPISQQGLSFIWETGDSLNLLYDPQLDAEVGIGLTPRGAARLDRLFRMLPAGGQFEATEAASRRTVLESKKTYEISLEMTLDAHGPQQGKAVIVTSASESRRNFSVEQQGSRLFLTLRMKSRGEQALPRVPLMALPANRAAHVVITYSPGKLQAYLDGQPVAVESSFEGGFFHWRPAPLVFGNDWNGKRPWRGTLEGVAFYSRVLGEDEVRESFLRYQSKIEARPVASVWTVRGSWSACSAAPTPKQIEPYREALVVCHLRVLQTLAGEELPAKIRVARWSMLDRRDLQLPPAASAAAELELGLLTENPQLESVFLSDTLEPREAGPIYFLQTP